MTDKEQVMKGLELCSTSPAKCNSDCPYMNVSKFLCFNELMRDALELLKEQEKEIEALRLLVEWAEECDFGFDQFPDEYEQYKDEITDMKYIEGMIHVAKRTLEDHGVFEEMRKRER